MASMKGTKLDFEGKAIDAHARLAMLGALIQHFDPKRIADTSHDVSFVDLGKEVCLQAQALQDAFYELYAHGRSAHDELKDLRRDQRLGIIRGTRGVANG